MDELFSAILAPILLLGPGYALLPTRLPERLRFPWLVFVSVAVSSATGVLLTLASCFDIWWLIALGWTSCVVRLLAGPRPEIGLRHHWRPLLLTALLGAFVLGTGGEAIDANGDSGVYAIAAVHIAESGGWSWPRNEVIPEGVPDELAISTPQLVRPWQEVAPGFIVRGERVSPQFLPLYPVWGAVFSTWFGLRGLLAVNIVGALLLLLAMEMLARLFVEPGWRWLVSAAVLLNPIFLVFLKYPTAEVFLAGILSGLVYSLVLFLRAPSPGRAWIPAALLALALLTKFFAVAVAGVVGLALLWLSRLRLPTAAPFGVLAVSSLGVGFCMSGPHLVNHLGQLTLLTGAKLAGVGCLLLALARFSWQSRWTKTVVVAAGFLYGLMVCGFWVSGRPAYLSDLALLEGRWVVALSTLGVVVFLFRRRGAGATFPAILFMLVNLYLFLGSGDSPFYPFAARRFLPLTVPLGALFLVLGVRFVAAVVSKASVVAGSALGARVIGVVGIGLVLAGPLAAQRSAVAVPHGRGFVDTLNRIREVVPEDRLVLALDRAWRYAPFLLLLDQKPVFCVDVGDPSAMLQAARFLDAHATALVFSAPALSPTQTLATVEEQRVGIATRRRPPLIAGKPRGARFVLFEPSRASDGLDVGVGDELWVRGAYRAEMRHGRSFRWTGRTVWLAVPPARKIRFVWSKSAHPEGRLPVHITCRGETIGRARIAERGWVKSRWFALPPSAERLLVELHTHTFQPSAVHGTEDERNLGLKLDRVEVR